MDTAYSWLRRSVSKIKKTTLPSSTTIAAGNNVNISKNKLQEEEEEKIYGINDKLVEFVKSFTLETFKSFSVPDEEENSSDGGGNYLNLRSDLSDWQEKHAMLALSRVKELAQLRFQLCPRFLKERQFWIIYFSLVRSYVAEYEMRAVHLAKLEQMRMANGTVCNSSACEVEMSETKFAMSVEDDASSMEQNVT